MAGMTIASSAYDDVLTVAEAAAEARRSVRTIRRAYRAGKLAAFRDGNGRGVRIRREDLRRWMMATAAAPPRSPAGERPLGQIRHRKRSQGRPEPSENLTLLRAARQRRTVPRRVARA